MPDPQNEMIVEYANEQDVDYDVRLPNLGDEARDRVSGYEGIVTAVAFYIGAIPRVLITRKATDGNARTEEWFDAPRIEITVQGLLTL